MLLVILTEYLLRLSDMHWVCISGSILCLHQAEITEKVSSFFIIKSLIKRGKLNLSCKIKIFFYSCHMDNYIHTPTLMLVSLINEICVMCRKPRRKGKGVIGSLIIQILIFRYTSHANARCKWSLWITSV